jgi:lanosterol synthase
MDDFNPPALHSDGTALQAAKNGATFLKYIQQESGIFPMQYQGPMFMTIGYVVAHYFTKTSIPEYECIELIRYLVNTSHPVDGGWGLHSVDKSTCFGTTMNYVCLRLLGLDKDHPVCVKARNTLLKLGSALKNPHWGKSWLSVLNLYKWEGVNPTPPELWALPYALPIHPGRWWVHTRAIYLPLGYLAADSVKCEEDDLIRSLREEIYGQDYDSIDFSKHRDDVCGIDLYYPHSTLLDIANKFLSKWEQWRPKWLLNSMKSYIFDLVLKELQNTENLSIAPVNAAFNTIVVFQEQGDSPLFQSCISRLKECLFHGPQGLTVMGTNGGQVWDCAFALQYLFMAGLAEIDDYIPMVERGYRFLVNSQFTEECVKGSFRDKRVGGFPFSTKEQGYTVSDCTAESMKAIIMVRNSDKFQHLRNLITDERLNQSVDVLLSLQNVGSFEFGSFATYEKIKATPLMELLNPAEVFANIMVEYPYVECTDSVVLGLTFFRKYSDYRATEVDVAIKRAIAYIKKAQDKDGSWYGCWGICYTYAGMFALEALHTVGESYSNSEAVRRGCDFLVKRQRADGGWSESMKSCELHSYVETEKSLVVQTSWSLIGLILAEYPDKEVIRRGIQLLMDRQHPDGRWPFEDIEGVFNHSCAIEYQNYRFLFPIKALGLYAQSSEI